MIASSTRGLRHALRRHAAPSPDRDRPATTKMKKVHCETCSSRAARLAAANMPIAERRWRLFLDHEDYL